MRAEPWFKITDEEIAAYIREGRTAKQIAETADMHVQTIKNRIKRMEESGDMMRLISEGAEDVPYIEYEDGIRFNRMDTIMHKAMKFRYRIVHIYGEAIVIKRVFQEDYCRSYKQGPILINKKTLREQYEKRDLGAVKCYIDESLIGGKNE